MINIFTFKWGSLYDHRYPNRLFGSLKKHCTIPFKLTCITDDRTGIHPDIEIIDYNTFDPFDYPKDRIFTREKLVLMERFQEGNNFWIDLDILIQDNIDDLIKSQLQKPTFIWNDWQWKKKLPDPLRWYGKGSMCYVNSSFVGWTGSAGQHLYQFLYDSQEKLFYTYPSLDKMLFYQVYRRDWMGFWPEGLFYNYNFSEPAFEFRLGYKASLYNTSHIRNGASQGVAYELHEAEGWPKRMWESYEKD